MRRNEKREYVVEVCRLMTVVCRANMPPAHTTLECDWFTLHWSDEVQAYGGTATCIAVPAEDVANLVD
jgi:hypothetical protein